MAKASSASLLRGSGEGGRYARSRPSPAVSPVDPYSLENFSGKDFEAVWGFEEYDRKTIRNIFGRDLSIEEIGLAVGAPNGSVLSIYAGGNSDFYVEVDHPLLRSNRRIAREMDDDGVSRIIARNDSLKLRDGVPRNMSIGTRSFAQQVKAMARLGVNRIETTAGRSKDLNGYYTWARVGYDGPISSRKKRLLLSDTGIRASTVREIMQTREGRVWWKSQGEEFDGVFYLGRGSTSLQDLDSYLAGKGISVG